MTRLLAGPIIVDLPPGPIGPGGPTTITYAFVVDNLRGALQFPPIWSRTGRAARGDIRSQRGHRDTGRGDRLRRRTPSAARRPTSYDNSPDALLAVACSETDNPHAASRGHGRPRGRSRRPYFGADWTWLSLPCATWPAHDHDRGRGSVRCRDREPVAVRQRPLRRRQPVREGGAGRRQLSERAVC